jgi:hypothetical protein
MMQLERALGDDLLAGGFEFTALERLIPTAAEAGSEQQNCRVPPVVGILVADIRFGTQHERGSALIATTAIASHQGAEAVTQVKWTSNADPVSDEAVGLGHRLPE